MKAKVLAVTVSLGLLFSGISLAQTAFSITAGPTATNVTGTSATIRWSLTSVATGQVQYGPTASYGKVTTPELSYKYSTHIQTISGLASGTTYHFRVISKTASGVQVLSPDSTFTTASLTSGSSGSTPSDTGSTPSNTGSTTSGTGSTPSGTGCQ
jgi:Purple acid Phosphatase, N-terminal domain